MQQSCDFIAKAHLFYEYLCYNAGMQEIIPDRHIVYKNGAVYDREAKRIVFHRPDLATVDTRITSENAIAMVSHKLERKRERLQAGANRIAAEGGQYDGTDLDFVEALAEVQMMKALNPDDPKSTDAARFLIQESGLAEKQAAEPQVQATNDTINALAGLLQAITAAVKTSDNSNVVDGEVSNDKSS